MSGGVAGKVYLVGGGPGDPRLLTLRGLQLLQRADLVLYDGLASPLLLRHTAASTERTSRRLMTQEQINDRMIAAAREGKVVVRLKGGDPFIFGRGSEEATALRGAGIEFEVVPGITAATAAAEYAGFSLTHREESSAVALITGHEDPAKPATRLDYQKLAQFPGTLVFYMGLHRLPIIVAALLEQGLSPDTPAAVISRASTPFQRTVRTSLGALPAAVAEAQLRAPSLLVIGTSLSLDHDIGWFDDLPLRGVTIGVTRPAAQAEPQVQAIVAAGGYPVLMPLIDIQPVDDWNAVDDCLQSLARYQWIAFTSANAVEQFLGRLTAIGRDVRQLAHCQLACIGASTAAALRKFSLQADLVPPAFRAEELAESLLARMTAGQRVLWPRANRGRDVLPERLRAAGVRLDEVVVYRHVDLPALPDEALDLLVQGRLDWMGLSSPSIAQQWATLLAPLTFPAGQRRPRIACISPVTAAAAVQAGLNVDVVAEVFTWDGLLQAIQSAPPAAQ